MPGNHNCDGDIQITSVRSNGSLGQGVCPVKLNSLFAVALVLGAVALTMRSQTTAAKPAAMPKIAVIQMRDAMVATQEGQAAGKAMQVEFGPKRAALEKEDAAIMALDEQLKKGAAT